MDRGRKQYYWIVANDPESGKQYIILGGNNEEQSRMRGLELFPSLDFDIKRLPTRDVDTASRILKGQKLEKTHSLTNATKRVGRTKSINRMRHKYLITGEY
jgi:hypothetical protein